jgi:2,3,4,5-tetrahydropyridine-2-carboxylate N-succinyltransferase
VVLTRGTPVYDLVNERVIRAAPGGGVLQIPANAVVVPGARQVGGGWGKSQGISLQTPVIVKYRDEKTDLATALEGWLR